MMRNVFSYFLIITLFHSCKPDCDEYYLRDYAKTFGKFQKGSYWIYQNDSSLVQDSFYVFNLHDGVSARQSDGYVVERHGYYDCTLASTLNPPPVPPNYNELLKHGYHIVAGINDGGYYYSPRGSIHYNFQDLSIIKAYIEKEPVVSYSSMQLNGKTYNSVYEISNSGSDSTVARYSIYLTSGIGLIKWIVLYNDSSTETWSLLRSNIVF